MAIEIERKYLVASLPSDLDSHPHDLLEQGYLAISSDGGEVRIRRGKDACVLTLKQGSGLTRLEEEIAITNEIFESLWQATEGRRIEKVRYKIPADHVTIELDRYLGAYDGLLVAEVEFLSEELANDWTPPFWFGQEVTEDCSYKNQNLALNNRPDLILNTQSTQLKDEYPEGFDIPQKGHPLWKLTEREILEFIASAIRERQDYDAGMAILFASQTGRLSTDGLHYVADLILEKFTFLRSKIGAIIYPRVCRSIGTWLVTKGDSPKGMELLTRGILSSLWRPSRAGRLEDWFNCPYREKLPKNIFETISSLEDEV